MLGFTYQELTSKITWNDITASHVDLDNDLKELKALITGKDIDYEIIKYYITKGGERLHVKLIITRVPYTGEVDWFFVEAEVLGDEHKEAFQYATNQITKLAEIFTNKHAELVGRVDKLIAQQQEIIVLWQQSQWVARIMAAGVNWLAVVIQNNPIYSAITGVVIATLLFGQPVVDTIREVCALFGIRLGVTP